MSAPLGARLEALGRSQGARFFGIADLAPAREEVWRLGGAEVASYPRAVSIGVALSHEIVDRLPERAQREVAAAYRGHIDEVKRRLRRIEAELAEALRHHGHSALMIPVSERKDERYPDAIFSHKLAARLAGLGWVGKSCLLVTPELGPRVRWTTVLTDAPLQATGAPGAERCGSCKKCVEICPVAAFSGRAFEPGEPREARFDAAACDNRMAELERETGFKSCGLCVYVCPFGRRASARESDRGAGSSLRT
jgi:epoxyqueuosine reductase QueG